MSERRTLEAGSWKLECGTKGETIFERSVPARRGYRIPMRGVPDPSTRAGGPSLRMSPPRGLHDQVSELLPEEQAREGGPQLPEVSELDVIRHYTRLSQLNFSVDTHGYPLGSCTMKYNPKLNDRIAALPGFARLHPLQPVSHVQGLMELLAELEESLCALTGMDAFTLQPAAGAQGELTGLKMIAAYHHRKHRARSVVLIPDSAHGTNPASAAMSGFEVDTLRSGPDGLVDLKELTRKLTPHVAALMLTNPNTLGLFERQILAITALVHEQDALVYMDGANLNALLGIARPGDMGVDLLQLNLHKTFSTPHGGGGPGAGPVGVRSALADFLPVPRVRRVGRRVVWDERNRASIGRVHGFYGNVGVLVRAYAYIRSLGREGLSRAGQCAILNANYLKARLERVFPVPFGRHCLHEFVLTLRSLKGRGLSAWEIAKRLLDYGFYAPTVFFPQIVDNAFMIEPTETESPETLDRFADALERIAEEAAAQPDLLRHAPHTMPVGRVDEVRAAREPNVRWLPSTTTAQDPAQSSVRPLNA